MAKNGKMERGNKPSHEQIAQRAYEIYERNGCQPGKELENWLAAEAELREGSSQKQSSQRQQQRPTQFSSPQRAAA